MIKVNQILLIMQEYFGKSMNQARIKLIPLLIHAFCVVQTFSLYKFMAAMPGAAKRDSTDSKGLTEYVLTILLDDRRLYS